MAAAYRSLIASCFLLCLVTTAGARTPRSLSTSRQFIVYGPDQRLRGAVCELAEQTKRIALSLLHERDDWKTPIVIHAAYPEANLPELPPVQLEMSQTGFGLKLQLDLRMGRDLGGHVVQRELLRATLLEMMYRAHPETPAGTAYVQPPDWLLDGVLALADGSDLGPLVDALPIPSASDNLIRLDEFLRQKPGLLESPSRFVYRAYSAALVSMLTRSAEGPERLARFVGKLPESVSDLADLKSHFPSLGDSDEKLQQSWTAAVKRLAATERYRMLSCEESEQQLAKILHVDVRETKRGVVAYSLEEYAGFVKDPNAPGALRALTEQLLLLSGRANPLYRPVVAEYQQIVTSLARKKTKGITRRLAELRSTREHIVRRMGAIDDYMNWFEATQFRNASGAFDEYMKAAERSATEAPRRRDPISVYLDALEAQMGN